MLKVIDMLALEGVRILDLTWQGPGPFGTMILGDLGAEIIQIGATSSADARQTTRGANRRTVHFRQLTVTRRVSCLI